MSEYGGSLARVKFSSRRLLIGSLSPRQRVQLNPIVRSGLEEVASTAGVWNPNLTPLARISVSIARLSREKANAIKERSGMRRNQPPGVREELTK